MTAESGQSAGHDYDVCLSFAGEQRDYVDEVAKLLRDKRIRVFYDNFPVAGLWGEDLVEYLDKVFRLRSRFCVVFISAEYATKSWTRLERRSILSRAFHSAGVYVLPVRFDDTDVAGLLDTVGSVDAREASPAEVADMLYTRITNAPPVPRTTPQARADQRDVEPRRSAGAAVFSGFTQHAGTIYNVAGDVHRHPDPTGTRDA